MSFLQSLIETFEKGGVVMYPIFAFSVLGSALVIYKWFYFTRLEKDTENFCREFFSFIEKRDMNLAAGLCRARRIPMARIMVSGLKNHLTVQSQHNHPEFIKGSEEKTVGAIREVILGEIPRMERHLSTIAVTATILPMLGLLGTITGMITTFEIISIKGTGDPRTLGAGISEALITTEAGLITSIPLIFMHNHLSNRYDRLIASIEQNAARFLNIIGK
ncbi:MAG: MotA/TolQ/ExbB proton channel family protein [Nitrospinota bacterium]